MTRRVTAVSVFCFFLLATATSAGTGRALGAPDPVPNSSGTSDASQTSPQAPTIQQLPLDASLAPESNNVFREPDEYTTVSRLAPLRTYTVPVGDLEIRIWQGLGMMRTEGIVLRRHNGVWSGDRLLGKRPQIQAVDFEEPIPKPEGGWEKLWQKLQANGVLTLPNQRADDGGGVLDGVSYLIETNKDGIYRGYYYDNPEHSKRQEDQQVVLIVKIVRAAINAPMEARHYWKEGMAPLPADIKRHLMEDTFTESYDVRDLPDWVKQAFTEGFPDSDFVLVNAGADFTTSVYPITWPQRRLSFLAVSGDYCVVACEYKGSHYQQKVLLFHKASKPKPFAADVYQAYSEVQLVPRSLREVRTLQAKGRFLQVQDDRF